MGLDLPSWSSQLLGEDWDGDNVSCQHRGPKDNPRGKRQPGDVEQFSPSRAPGTKWAGTGAQGALGVNTDMSVLPDPVRKGDYPQSPAFAGRTDISGWKDQIVRSLFPLTMCLPAMLVPALKH